MQVGKKLSAIHKKYIAFHELCDKNPKTYTVDQAARDVGTDFKTLKKWCKSEDGFEDDYFMSTCQFQCAINVGRAFAKGEITREEADKYLKGSVTSIHNLEYFVIQAKEKDKRDKGLRESLSKFGFDPDTYGNGIMKK